MMPSVNSSFLRRSGVLNARANAVSTVPPAPPALLAREVTVLRIDGYNSQAVHATLPATVHHLRNDQPWNDQPGMPLADIPGLCHSANELRRAR